MDGRWLPFNRDDVKDTRVFLHRTASLTQVAYGVSEDAEDITDFATTVNQSQFECTVGLRFNEEFFGDGKQPQTNQILELQLYQAGEWGQIYLGIITSINEWNMSRGERSLQLIARTRDSLSEWRETKRSTDLFPQMTDYGYITRRIARSVGLLEEEILIPQTAYATAHSNTQLADMSAWDMISAIFLPIGWSPFFDTRGRLRVADRQLQGRVPDIILEDEQVMGGKGGKSINPVSRVAVKWLNPMLKKSLQQGRKLTDLVMTMGWFLPFLWKTIHFSEDKTQRAEGTYMIIKQSCNTLVPFCDEEYHPRGENEGRVTLTNYAFAAAIFTFIGGWTLAHNIPDAVVAVGGGSTIPVGRKVEGYFQLAFTLLLMNLGTGIYEIWGTPFEWVHARNTTEVFNDALPTWADRPKEIECDFIESEEHAKAVAVRELIYETRSAHKWTLEMVDDPRIEFGDVVQFPDGHAFYVEDFDRPLERGSVAQLTLKGFLIS